MRRAFARALRPPGALRTLAFQAGLAPLSRSCAARLLTPCARELLRYLVTPKPQARNLSATAFSRPRRRCLVPPPAPCHSTALSFRSHRRGISLHPLGPARTLFARAKCPHRLTPAPPSPSPPSDERGGRHSLPEGVSCRAPQVPVTGCLPLAVAPHFFLFNPSFRAQRGISLQLLGLDRIPTT